MHHPESFTSEPFPPPPSSVLMVHILGLSIWMCSGPWKLPQLSACTSAGLAAAGFHANTWHQLLVKYSSDSTDHAGAALHFASDYRNTPYWIPLQRLPAFIYIFFLYFEVVKQFSKSETKAKMVWSVFENWTYLLRCLISEGQPSVCTSCSPSNCAEKFWGFGFFSLCFLFLEKNKGAPQVSANWRWKHSSLLHFASQFPFLSPAFIQSQGV